MEIASGQIVIDSIDISRVRLSELRSRLSIIPQEDGILFCSSIRENLDPHGRFSDVQLWQCLETVHLKALVSSLPEKLGEVNRFVCKILLHLLLTYFCAQTHASARVKLC
jgi:ABC-type multidrug transport system fused ATPase/permease subunit